MTSPDEQESEDLVEADRALVAAYEQRPVDLDEVVSSKCLAARTAPPW
jgi:hypothetical protein